MALDLDFILQLAREFWAVVGQMAPFLLLGFLLAGMFHMLIPTEWVVRQLGGRGVWPVVKAALIGIPVPLCSCGILPVAASLRRAGASRGPTASFLISSPETDIDNIVLTWGIMGPLFSIYRVAVSMVNSIGAGLLIDRFGGQEPELAEASAPEGGDCCSTAAPKASCCSTSVPQPASCCAMPTPAEVPPTGLQRLVRFAAGSLHYAFIMLPRDLAGPLLVGLGVAAVLTLLGQWLLYDLLRGTDPVVGILGVMLLSLPMYVCSTSSIPIAATLVYNAGLTPGAALAFMIAGPATNAAAVSLLWRMLGPRSTVIYLASIAVTAFGAGLLLDKVFALPGHAFCTSCATALPGWLTHVLSVLMLVMLLVPLVQRWITRRAAPSPAAAGPRTAQQVQAAPAVPEIKMRRRGLTADGRQFRGQ